MSWKGGGMLRSWRRLFFVFGLPFVGILFVVIVIIVVVRVFFVIIVVIVFGKHDDVHGMSLRHFEFGVALRAGENLAFFHFVFVQVDLGIAFWALRHVTRLLPTCASNEKVLYTATVKLSAEDYQG
jgi:hypothetical protein